MRLPEENDDYYSLEEVADQWRCTVERLLYLGWTRKLELCVYVHGGSYIMGEGEWSPEKEQKKREKSPHNTYAGDWESLPGGLYPVVLLHGDWKTPGQLVPKSLDGEPIAIKHPKKKAYAFLTENDYDDSTLFITHKEKCRFEAACDRASNDDIGEKERTTWLKIIYLLMHKLANHQSNLAKPSGVNASQLAEVLKKAAKEYGLSDAGLSKSTLSEIYNEADKKLEPDHLLKK